MSLCERERERDEMDITVKEIRLNYGKGKHVPATFVDERTQETILLALFAIKLHFFFFFLALFTTELPVFCHCFLQIL